METSKNKKPRVDATLARDLAGGNTPLHIAMTIGTDAEAVKTIMLLLKADRRATLIENKRHQIPLETISYKNSPLIWEALAVVTLIAIGESKCMDEKTKGRFMGILKEIRELKRDEILFWDLTKALKTLGMLADEAK